MLYDVDRLGRRGPTMRTRRLVSAMHIMVACRRCSCMLKGPRTKVAFRGHKQLLEYLRHLDYVVPFPHRTGQLLLHLVQCVHRGPCPLQTADAPCSASSAPVAPVSVAQLAWCFYDCTRSNRSHGAASAPVELAPAGLEDVEGGHS